MIVLFDTAIVFLHESLVGGSQQYGKIDKGYDGGNACPGENQHQYAGLRFAKVEFVYTDTAQENGEYCGNDTAFYWQRVVALECKSG